MSASIQYFVIYWTGDENFGSSLGLLMDMGGFEDDRGGLKPVAESTINRIEEWASENGW